MRCPEALRSNPRKGRAHTSRSRLEHATSPPATRRALKPGSHAQQPAGLAAWRVYSRLPTSVFVPTVPNRCHKATREEAMQRAAASERRFMQLPGRSGTWLLGDPR